MGIFASLGIGLVTKVISGFGLPALNSWLDHLKSADVQWTKRWVVAAEGEVETKKAAMQYRIALLNTKVGALLVLLVVGPPALHWALVWMDTIFLSFGLPLIGVEKAPAAYASLGRDIMLTFIGVKGVAGVSNVLMRGLGKR